MSLIEWLKKLFGLRRQKKKVCELTTTELKELIREKGNKNVQTLELSIAKIVAEIKHNLLELEKKLEALKQEQLNVEEGNVRLRQIVKTSKEKVEAEVLTLIEKLKPPETTDIQIMANYAMNSAILLEKTIIGFGKNIAYTGVLFSEKIKEIGKTISELNNSFISLNKILKESAAAHIPSILGEISKVELMVEECKKAEEECKKIEYLISENDKMAEQITFEIESIKNSPAALQLKNDEKKLAELATKEQECVNKMNNLLAPVEKPLRRLLQISQSDSLLTENESQILELYLGNSLAAIKQDPRAEILKKILAEAKKLIIEGKISLKEEEREKKITALDVLLGYDFFTEFFWELNKIKVESLAIEKRIEQNELHKKIKEKESELKKINQEKKEMLDNLERKRKSLENIKQNIDLSKIKIEKDYATFFGEQVVLKI